MAGTVWTDEENDVIVGDYFAMLAEELAGPHLNKASHNRALQTGLDRNHRSIEAKHQNISAVLKGLGETWIQGYKPYYHFQNSLVDAVARWLAAHPSWLAPITRAQVAATAGSFRDSALWIGPPPTHSNQLPPSETEQMMAIARKLDVAERDARNRALGRAGEERVIMHERETLKAARRPDLSRQVRWISDEEGDGAGYDILSFDPSGRTRLIEVKTTNGWERTPFHLSRNELAVADARREDWRLLRLWNFARDPKAFELRPPLERHLALTPTSFQADLH